MLAVLVRHHQYLVLQSPMQVAVEAQLMPPLEMALAALVVAVRVVLRLLAELLELPIQVAVAAAVEILAPTHQPLAVLAVAES